MNTPSMAAPFSGWRVNIALALLVSTGVAFTNAFGVVFEAVAADMQLSRAQVGIGMSLMMLSIGLTAPIMGRLADIGPIRPTMLGGVIAMLLGIAVMTHTTSGWVLAAGMLVCCVGIALHGMVPSNAIANNWFVASRARALAVIAIGLSIGGLWIPPMTAWLMAHGTVENDWRYALQVMALGLALVAGMTIVFGVVRRPEDLGQHADGDAVHAQAQMSAGDDGQDESFASAKKSRDLWFLALSFAFITMAAMVNGAFLVPLLEERGIAKLDAAYALSVVAFASMIGSLLAGLVADRTGPKIVLQIAMSTMIVAFTVLLWQHSYIVSLFMAGAVGLGVGAFMPMQPTTAGVRFGRAIAGRIIGVYGITQLPFTLGAIPLVATIADKMGTYNGAFVAAIVFLLIALTLTSVSSFSADGTQRARQQ